MRAVAPRLLAALLLAAAGAHGFAAERGALPDWILASADGRAIAGQRFELLVVGPPGEEPPKELQVRFKSDVDELLIKTAPD